MIFKSNFDHGKTLHALTKYILMLVMTGLFILPAVTLPAKMWETFTNTNHVTDAVMTQDKIYTATWGGVVEYRLLNPTVSAEAEYVRTITSVDGLVSNDVRTLAYEESTGDLWAGTFNNGISIIKTSGMQTLDATSGLPSNKIRRIIVDQSYIYVATDLGISQFYYLPEVFFPLLLHQYNIANTQGGLVSNDVRDITVSDSGYLYCATASGVSFVHKDSLDIDTAWHQWVAGNSPLPNAPILSISAGTDFIAMNSLTSVHRIGSDPFASDWQTWTRANGLQDSVFTVKFIYQEYHVFPGQPPITGEYLFCSYGVWNEDNMTLTRKIPNGWGSAGPTGDIFTGIGSYDWPPTCIYRFCDLGDNITAIATWGSGVSFWDNSTQYDFLPLFNNCIGFQTISEIKTDANHNIWLGGGWLGPSMTKKGTRGVSKWSNGTWNTYTTKNSPLTSDNISSLAVDWNNKKWFGSWDASGLPYNWQSGAVAYGDTDEAWQWYTRDGIRAWNDSTGWSAADPTTPKIYNNTIAEIYVDQAGNIFVSSSGAGMTVLDKDYNFLGYAHLPASFSQFQLTISIHHSGSRYFFGTRNDRGLIIWDSDTLPISTENHWIVPPVSELNSCVVHGVVTIVNAFQEEENWIATSLGLFMWDGTNWYKYDTDIKRRRYSNGLWVNDTLYYVDEERLFGSVRTTPTSIYLDPFGRIWIGSLENGFTMYDPVSEHFTNYFMANSPLLSNYITCFGYDPIRGKLLIGTPDGLNTLDIGIEIKTEEKLRTVKAFPNPFFPDRDGIVRIVNLPSQSMPKGSNVCKIYNSAGELVIELKENYFARFDWNGRNKNNKKCSSGIYFFVVTDANGKTERGKIALIRGN